MYAKMVVHLYVQIHLVRVVKSRSNAKFGHPLEAIGREKAHRLQRLALAWIATHDLWGADYRIDCAAVDFSDRLNPAIDYRPGVL